jgi:hypothetical protein
VLGREPNGMKAIDARSSARDEASIASRRLRLRSGAADTVLAKAIVRARIRRDRCRRSSYEVASIRDVGADDSCLEHERRPPWRLVMVWLLLAVTIGSLVYVVNAIIARTQPFPTPPSLGGLDMVLPAGVEKPRVTISFAPGTAKHYITATEFDRAAGEALEAGEQISVFTHIYDTYGNPVLTPSGKPINVQGWAHSNNWKVLIRVTAILSAGSKARSYPLEVVAGPHRIFSHVVTGAFACRNPRIEKPGLYSSGAQAFFLRPCQERTSSRHLEYDAEGILRSPIELDTSGHVDGALPLLGVDRCRGHNCQKGKFVPFQVVVSEPFISSAVGLQTPRLSAVDVTPVPSPAYGFLLWDAKKPLFARWSWAVIDVVNHSQALVNIFLVLTGVASALVVTLGGYLIKGKNPDKFVVDVSQLFCQSLFMLVGYTSVARLSEVLREYDTIGEYD